MMRRQQCSSFSFCGVSSSSSNPATLNNRGGLDNSKRNNRNRIAVGSNVSILSSVKCAPAPLGCLHEPRVGSNSLMMRMSSNTDNLCDGAGAIYACQRRGYLWGQTSLYRSLLTDPRSEVEGVFFEKEPACANMQTSESTSDCSSGTLPTHTSVHHAYGDSPSSANAATSSASSEVPTSPHIPRHLLQGVNNMYLSVSYPSSLSSSSPQRRSGEGNRKQRVEGSDKKLTTRTCEKNTSASAPSTFISASSNSSQRSVSENILRTRVVLCPPAAASTCVVLEPWRSSKGEGSLSNTTPKSNINTFYSREHSKDLVRVFPHLASQQRCRPSPTTPTLGSSSHQLYVPTSPADGPQGFLLNAEMVRCNGFTDSTQEQILAAFSLFPPHALTADTDASGEGDRRASGVNTNNEVKEDVVNSAEMRAEIKVEEVQDDLGASAVEVREEVASLSDFIRASLVRLLTLERATTKPADGCTAGRGGKEKENSCFLRMLQADALTSGIPLCALVGEAEEAVQILKSSICRSAGTKLSAGGGSGRAEGGQQRADATTVPSVTCTRVVFSSYRKPFLDFITVLVQTLESLEESNICDRRTLTSSSSHCASEAARRSIVWCPSSVSPMASLYIADTIREAVLRWRHPSARPATVMPLDTSLSEAEATIIHVDGGSNNVNNGCGDAGDRETPSGEDGSQVLHDGELEAFAEQEKGLLSLCVVYGGLPSVDALMRRIVTVATEERRDDAQKRKGGTEGPLVPKPQLKPGFTVFGVPDSPHSALISWGRSLWLPPSSASASSLSVYHVGDEAAMCMRDQFLFPQQKRGNDTELKGAEDADVGVLEAVDDVSEAVDADALVLLPPRSTLNYVRNVVRDRMARLAVAGDTEYKTDEGEEINRQEENIKRKSDTRVTAVTVPREEEVEFKRTAALICKSFVGKHNGTEPFGLRRVYVPKSWLFGPPKSLKETSEAKGDFSLATKERIEKEEKAEAEAVEIVRGAIRKLPSVKLSAHISEKREIPLSLDVKELKRCISEWERKEALRVYFDCVKGEAKKSDAARKDNAPSEPTTVPNASPSSSSSSAFPSLFLPSLLGEIKVAYTLGHPLDLKTQLGPLPAVDVLGRCEEVLKTKYASASAKVTSIENNDRTATAAGASAPHTPLPFPPPFTRIVCGGFRPILPAKGGHFFLPSIVSVMEPRIARPPSFKSALASLSGGGVGGSGQHQPPAVSSSYDWHPICAVPKEGPTLLLYPYDDELLFNDVYEEGVEANGINSVVNAHISTLSPPSTPATTIDELVTVPPIVLEHHAYCWAKLTKSS